MKATGHDILRNGLVVGWREVTGSWPGGASPCGAMVGLNIDPISGG
ncbi:MAG: hypothetical protein WCS01_09505 [bacterium]